MTFLRRLFGMEILNQMLLSRKLFGRTIVFLNSFKVGVAQAVFIRTLKVEPLKVFARIIDSRYLHRTIAAVAKSYSRLALVLHEPAPKGDKLIDNEFKNADHMSLQANVVGRFSRGYRPGWATFFLRRLWSVKRPTDAYMAQLEYWEAI